MGKILTVNFSHRIKGNSDALLSIAKNSISTLYPEKQSKRINLKNYNIKACNGCMSCVMKNEFCYLADDYKQFTDELISSESLIIATPVYFLGAPSIVKTITDRMLYYNNIIDFSNPKPAKIIITAGRDGWLGNVVENLAIFLFSSGFFIEDLKIFYAQGPSEVLLQDNIAQEIELLVKNANSGFSRQNPSTNCPLCKTDRFKINSANQIECSICNIKGEIISYENNRTLILFDDNDINNSRWEYNNLKNHMVDWVGKSGAKYKSQIREILKKRKQLLS